MTNEPLEKYLVDNENFKELKDKGHLINVENMDKYLEERKQMKEVQINKDYWKDKRVIATGAAGMVSSTIMDELLAAGAEVHGIVRRHAVSHLPYIQQHIDDGKMKVYEADLRDYLRVNDLIKDIDPHAIFHQAAESFVPTSLQQPGHVTQNNCVSTVNILEACNKHGGSIEGIQLACSSEQYGFVKNIDELPVKETNELRPTSTYAATKVFTEYVGKAYYYMYKTPTVITRTFNQEGPRRGLHFFTSIIAKQIARILKKKQENLVMGNPNSVRDFTHIHETARAQIIAIEKCNKGEPYNICSGVGIKTGDYAKLALRTFDLEGKTGLFIDPARIRPYERGECLFDGFIGDNSKFSEKTGWKPAKTIMDIIRDGVEFYSDLV